MKTIFAKHDQKGHDAHQYSALKSAIGTRALINLLDCFVSVTILALPPLSASWHCCTS
jgi:hypothetical protein